MARALIGGCRASGAVCVAAVLMALCAVARGQFDAQQQQGDPELKKVLVSCCPSLQACKSAHEHI